MTLRVKSGLKRRLGQGKDRMEEADCATLAGIVAADLAGGEALSPEYRAWLADRAYLVPPSPRPRRIVG